MYPVMCYDKIYFIGRKLYETDFTIKYIKQYDLLENQYYLVLLQSLKKRCLNRNNNRIMERVFN